jgi:hypothetical protein
LQKVNALLLTVAFGAFCSVAILHNNKQLLLALVTSKATVIFTLALCSGQREDCFLSKGIGRKKINACREIFECFFKRCRSKTRNKIRLKGKSASESKSKPVHPNHKCSPVPYPNPETQGLTEDATQNANPELKPAMYPRNPKPKTHNRRKC